MGLTERFEWRGRQVRWGSEGSGSPVVFCHGTPWSSALWAPIAHDFATDFTVYLWDMPGYGVSSKAPEQRVALDVQGELFAALLEEWGLRTPFVVAHDYGGAVSLRAHLLHGAEYASLALVDVVALAPWGSDFFRLVRDNADVFSALPAPIHEAIVRAYISGASHRGLSDDEQAMLAEPWLGKDGQEAFYQQIAEADQAYTDEVEPLYVDIEVPVHVVWGAEDTWIPVDRARRLAETIPGAQLTIIEDAGHLIQLDAPAALARVLRGWLEGR